MNTALSKPRFAPHSNWLVVGRPDPLRVLFITSTPHLMALLNYSHLRRKLRPKANHLPSHAPEPPAPALFNARTENSTLVCSRHRQRARLSHRLLSRLIAHSTGYSVLVCNFIYTFDAQVASRMMAGPIYPSHDVTTFPLSSAYIFCSTIVGLVAFRVHWAQHKSLDLFLDGLRCFFTACHYDFICEFLPSH